MGNQLRPTAGFRSSLDTLGSSNDTLSGDEARNGLEKLLGGLTVAR